MRYPLYYPPAGVAYALALVLRHVTGDMDESYDMMDYYLDLQTAFNKGDDLCFSRWR